jgi:hypothetical protein
MTRQTSGSPGRSLAATPLLAVVLAAGVLSLAPRNQALAQDETYAPADILWRDPVDIGARDLYYGPGGKSRQPAGTFTFVEEDLNGSSPKFRVTDEQGVRWKVKLGPEARPEVAATRFVWAAGYFADEDYYLPVIKVDNLPPKLQRGRKYVGEDGTVRGARLERTEDRDVKFGVWDWFNNPFAGTTELGGLRVLMAFINNWDVKTTNNSVRAGPGGARLFYVSDLGSAFGRGDILIPTANNPEGYAESKFIRREATNNVDFAVIACPKALAFLVPPYYWSCRRLERVVQHVPRADALWIGGILARLSSDQIADIFRAAGYDREQVEILAFGVRSRIAALNKL